MGSPFKIRLSSWDWLPLSALRQMGTSARSGPPSSVRDVGGGVLHRSDEDQSLGGHLSKFQLHPRLLGLAQHIGGWRGGQNQVQISGDELLIGGHRLGGLPGVALLIHGLRAEHRLIGGLDDAQSGGGAVHPGVIFLRHPQLLQVQAGLYGGCLRAGLRAPAWIPLRPAGGGARRGGAGGEQQAGQEQTDGRFPQFHSGSLLYIFCISMIAHFPGKNRTKSPHPALDRWKNVYYNGVQIQKRRQRTVPRAGNIRDGMAGANPTKARREGPLERGQAMARRLPTLRGSSVYLWYKFRWNHGSFDSP